MDYAQHNTTHTRAARDGVVPLRGVWMDLEPRVGEELVEEVHEEVDLEAAHTQHHVLLRLRPVAAVVPPGLLPLHPQKGQLLKLYSGRT